MIDPLIVCRRDGRTYTHTGRIVGVKGYKIPYMFSHRFKLSEDRDSWTDESGRRFRKSDGMARRFKMFKLDLNDIRKICDSGQDD